MIVVIPRLLAPLSVGMGARCSCSPLNSPWQDEEHDLSQIRFVLASLLGYLSLVPLAFRSPCYFTSLVSLVPFSFPSLLFRLFFCSGFSTRARASLYACGAHWKFAICSGVAVPIRMGTILNALIRRFSPKFYF